MALGTECYAELRKQAHYGECHYAECRYVNFRVAECRGAYEIKLSNSAISSVACTINVFDHNLRS